MPQFMLISRRIGPLTTDHRRRRTRRRRTRRQARGRERKNDREIFRPRARHHRVDRDLLDGEFPLAAIGGRLHVADHLVRRVAGAGEHLGDALFRRQHDRQRVGPVIFQKQPVQILFGVGREQARGVERSAGAVVSARDAARQPLDHFLHHRLAGDRILALDIGPQFVGRFAHHRLRHERARRIRQPLHPRGRRHHAVEDVGMQRDGGNAVLRIDRDRMGRNRRRAGAAMADAEDGAVAIVLISFHSFGIVMAVVVRQRDELGLHARHVLGEPRLDLLEQFDRVVEPAIDQIDRLAVERVEPRRGRLLRHLGRIADRIEDGDFGPRFLFTVSSMAVTFRIR